VSRIVVVGAGAIGGYFAYELGRAGHDIVLCVRRAFDRLVVETEGRVETLDAPVLTDPGCCPIGDWVLFATKAHQTASAAGWLDRACGDPTRGVAVLQNGIDHRDRVALWTGNTPVLPTVVRCAAEVLFPGRVRHHGFSTLDVPDGFLGRDFAELFTGTAATVVQRDEFEVAQWRKLLQNVAIAPLTALTGRRLEVLRRDDVRALSTGLAREAIAVGRAAGLPLVAEEAEALVEEACVAAPDMGTSMLYDRLAGRPLEVEELTGAVVRKGNALGVPVPLNVAVSALLGAIDEASHWPGGAVD
jgi:2-dehydropantoate 2-reductase